MPARRDSEIVLRGSKRACELFIALYTAVEGSKKIEVEFREDAELKIHFSGNRVAQMLPPSDRE